MENREKTNKDLKLAVLIDADNVPYASIDGMLDEIAKFGLPTIKRIYGDWTTNKVGGWKTPLLEHAITPIQQYGYTVGKNSTDSAMIIDAMDILHSEKVDGFCIVSSDSDFTRLAIRLRESGMVVIGLGERKTPKPFIVACDKFIYIEIISKEKRKKTDAPSFPPSRNFPAPVPNDDVEAPDERFINLLKTTIEDLEDDDGWAFLAEVGNLLIKKKPDFDPRNYGFHKLTPLIRSLRAYFEINERDVKNTHIKHVYVRNRK